MIRARHLLLLAPLALAACSSGEPAEQGYVEGTYVYIAADTGGRVVERPANAGARVAAGDVMFVLDDAEQREAVAGAEARLAQAEADLANLKTGQRPEELSVLAANLSAAEASLQTAEADLARKQQLLDRGVVARSVVDDARAARDTAQAHVDAARRQVSVAELPARPEMIAAAERNVAAQEAALAQSRIQLERRRVTAPAAGLITATTFEVGEQVPGGQPVVTLLPDANRKVRFYVAEPDLARVAIGGTVGVACDNCADGLTASIDFVSASAEFTPPIIYSRDSRKKLVFRVEARPLGETIALNVGQPVDVRLRSGGMTTAETIIDIKGLTKIYSGRAVVDHVDLTVKRGEIVGFLGPNGSGKTTTIRMICGLLKPDAGTGTCLGYDILTQSSEIKLEVGYMTQKFSLYEDLTIEENLDFVARLYDLRPREKYVADTLARLGLTARKNQLAGRLSGGWKQRLALAASVMHKPQLLLLDEPTAGVDPKARREFWDEIHELAAGGLTVLVSTHYMDEAERCHRIVYIAYGKVVARGTVPEVIAGSGLSTIVIEGADTANVAHRLRGAPGVDQIASFGTTLHVVGTDPAKLKASVDRAIAGTNDRAAPGETTLEDVFIRLMSESTDNFAESPGPADLGAGA